MLQIVIENLKNISIGLGIFVFAYLANMSFSLYYNVKVAGEIFDYNKMKNGILKMLSFLIGTLFLVVSVSVLPVYADNIGFVLPEDFVNAFSTLAIISVPLYGSCKYAILAFSKMKEVLNSSVSSGSENIEENTKEDTEINYNVGPVEAISENGTEEPDNTDYNKAEEERIIDSNVTDQ